MLGRNQIKVHPVEHQYQIVDCWLDRCDVLSGILVLGNDAISTSSFSLTSSDRPANASWRAAPTKNHDYAPPPTHPLSKNPYYSYCPNTSANYNQHCSQWKSST